MAYNIDRSKTGRKGRGMTKSLKTLEALRRRLASSPDGRLPSKASLREEFGVSAGTVSNAIRALKDEGLLRSVPGKGVFLVEPSSPASSGRGLLLGVCGCYLPGADALAEGGLSALSGNGVLQGFQAAALEASASLAIVPWNAEGFKPTALRSLKLDGLLVAGGAPESDLLKLARCGIPALLANYPAVPAPQLPFLDFDNAWAFEEALRVLKAKGRRRVACLAVESHSVPGYRDWLFERFAVGLAKEGLPFEPGFYRFASSRDAAVAVASELLALKRPPEALLCWNQELLLGALAAAKGRKLSVPGELSCLAACSFDPKARGSRFLHDGPGLGRALFEALRKRVEDPFAKVSGFLKPRYVEGGTA